MRYWYDTEFLEDGKTVALISIGVVAEDDREYYAVNSNIINTAGLWGRIIQSTFLMNEVIPKIMPVEKFREWDVPADVPMKDPRQIRADLEKFFSTVSRYLYAEPELWSYYSAYDHLALCQLWGTMHDKPSWMPWLTHDIASYGKILACSDKFPQPPKDQHHALADARWHREMHRVMERYL